MAAHCDHRVGTIRGQVAQCTRDRIPFTVAIHRDRSVLQGLQELLQFFGRTVFQGVHQRIGHHLRRVGQLVGMYHMHFGVKYFRQAQGIVQGEPREVRKVGGAVNGLHRIWGFCSTKVSLRHAVANDNCQLLKKGQTGRMWTRNRPFPRGPKSPEALPKDPKAYREQQTELEPFEARPRHEALPEVAKGD